MSAQIFQGRYTAEIEDDFVVFLIGSRQPLLQLIRHNWVSLSFFKMVNELEANPESGYLGGEFYFRFFPLETVLISYWRSFDDLEYFSRSRDTIHYPAWVRFYKDVGSNSKLGIWHETYMVRANEYECIYGNMPQFGLGKAQQVEHKALTGRSRARQRSGNDHKPATAEDVDLVMD